MIYLKHKIFLVDRHDQVFYPSPCQWAHNKMTCEECRKPIPTNAQYWWHIYHCDGIDIIFHCKDCVNIECNRIDIDVG